MTDEELKNMQAQFQMRNDELKQIVIEDVPHQYQKRLMEILNPVCDRCAYKGNIGSCIADSDYEIDFDRGGDTIIRCSNFKEG